MSFKSKVAGAIEGLGITVAETGVVVIISGVAVLGPLGLVALGAAIFAAGHDLRKP